MVTPALRAVLPVQLYKTVVYPVQTQPFKKLVCILCQYSPSFARNSLYLSQFYVHIVDHPHKVYSGRFLCVRAERNISRLIA